ncbi:hypothetical protein QTG54_014337 [Skeletonema marinoi]|uniref:WRKY19-like zinc finger domain-containing protein n=1 Tax=Skeletonema marinoi TaxID=267567 RepID=A0AAD9D5U0_9STRA|nr:hypothetical protein QTG54_014337 [Skeletonema marinoi]
MSTKQREASEAARLRRRRRTRGNHLQPTSTIKATAGEIRGDNSFATTADRKIVAKRKRPRLRRDDDEGKEAGKKAARKRYRYECSADGCTNAVKQGGVCIKHGAKVIRCNKEGCTNKAVKGGVCIRHGAKVKLCSIDGAQIELSKEVCAGGTERNKEEYELGMGQKTNNAALKGAQKGPSKEECAEGTERSRRSNDAATKDAPIKPKAEGQNYAARKDV